MSAQPGQRSTLEVIPGGQAELGHPRHGAHDHSAREMTMTSKTTMPPVRVIETDTGKLLTVQVVTYANTPLPAHLFVAVTDADTAEVLFSAHLLAHLLGDVAHCVTPVGQEVQRVAGARYRNGMLPIAEVLDKVGRVEGLWHVGPRQPARWRRQASIALCLTTAGPRFLLGPDPSNQEARGSVTTGGPTR